jgi:hypothetical protein
VADKTLVVRTPARRAPDRGEHLRPYGDAQNG